MRVRRFAGVAALALAVTMNLVVSGCTTAGTTPTTAPTTSTASTPTPTPSAPSPQFSAAGTLYLLIWGQKTVSVLPPGATIASTVDVGRREPGSLAVAPAGTPNAGTVYVADGSHAVSVIPPGATTVLAEIRVGRGPKDLVIAPAGAPNEGTVYVANVGDGTVSVIPPGATTVRTTVELDPSARYGTYSEYPWTSSILAIAPAGTPDAGTVYARGDKTVAVIPPGATAASIIEVGEIGEFGGAPVIAPAGTPNAGTVYIAGVTDTGTVSVLPPGATSVQATIPVGRNPGHLAVAPAGAPNAGTVYLPVYGDDPGVSQSVAVIPPGATTVQTTIEVGRGPFEPVIAPEGTPNAGALYLTSWGSDTVSVVAAGGTTTQTSMQVPNYANPPFMGPDGTLYLPIVNRLWIFPPGATTPCVVTIGDWGAHEQYRTGVSAIAFGPAQSPGEAGSASAGTAWTCPASSAGSASPTSSTTAPVSRTLILGTDGVIRDGDGKAMRTTSQKAISEWLEARVGSLTGDFAGDFGLLHVWYYDGRYHGWGYGASPQERTFDFYPDLASTGDLKLDTGVGLGSTYGQVLAVYPKLAKVKWDSAGGEIAATIPGTSLDLYFSGGANTYDKSSSSRPPGPDAVLKAIWWYPR